MLFISHDLAVVRMLADHVCVLFRGEIMEIGPRDQVFAAPFHPYTFSLLEAVPSPLKKRKPSNRRSPEAAAGGAGCAYAGRCGWEIAGTCRTIAPPWRTTGGGVSIRCHHSLDELQQRAALSNKTGKETYP
jgi:peptide/nickel transport system ATP-binding protein